MSGSIWNPASSASSDVSSQRIIATAAQTLFSITAFTYTPNINALLVYVNGAYKCSGVDYTETSASSITFTAGLNVNDKVDIVGLIAVVGSGSTSFLSPSGSVFITGSTVITAGAGLLVDYDSVTPVGRIKAFDFTNAVFKNLTIDGLTVSLNSISLGQVNVGGILNVTAANQSTQSGIGALVIAGGASVRKTLTVGGGTAGGSTSTDTNLNAIFIDGASNVDTAVSQIQLGDNFDAACRQWALVNGRSAAGQVQGSLFLKIATAVNTDAVTSGTVIHQWTATGESITGTLVVSGQTTLNSGCGIAGALTVGTGFGCNGAAAQTPVASGGAMAGYVTGAFGLDSDAHMTAMFNLVKNMRVALVANGIMS